MGLTDGVKILVPFKLGINQKPKGAGPCAVGSSLHLMPHPSAGPCFTANAGAGVGAQVLSQVPGAQRGADRWLVELFFVGDELKTLG